MMDRIEQSGDEIEPYFMSSDEILSCLIYVLVKANRSDTIAILTMVNYFTLEEH